MSASDILIRGAGEHNLRDVDLRLPRNRLICFTGVSGSGKSSLAFDTLVCRGAAARTCKACPVSPGNSSGRCPSPTWT